MFQYFRTIISKGEPPNDRKKNMHNPADPLRPRGTAQKLVRIPQEIFFSKCNFITVHAANEGMSGKVSSGRKEVKKWSSRNHIPNNC